MSDEVVISMGPLRPTWKASGKDFANMLKAFMGCNYLTIAFAMSQSGLGWINWSGIPIFFGLVTSSFEGIGTILPIEGSMEGNRHNFTKYLFGAVTVLAVVLITFGTLGYVHFGTDIEQMVNANIPSGDKMNILVNVSLIVGVLLTFPLMMHPVVELKEIMLFVTGCACSPIDHSDHDNEGEEQPLLPKTEGAASANGDKIPSHVPTWKRNIIRALLVLFAGGIAVLLRNYFAYISAFIGALGSTMLAYILPCLFHLKLCWANLCLATKIKDIAIIIIGITFGITGMYSVLHEIIA